LGCVVRRIGITKVSVVLTIVVLALVSACTNSPALSTPKSSLKSPRSAVLEDPDLPPVNVTEVELGNTRSTLPKNWQQSGFIEIFVRGYKDSNGDGVGDIRGIISQLDYIKSLGFGGVWLMPIHPSTDGDHGYAVADFRDINPIYGSLADFDELVRELHLRGMGLMIDYVINHSGSTNPLFLQSAASPNSLYRDWFVWKNEAPKGWSIFEHDPWHKTPNGAYLAQFSATMPDFNFKNLKVVDYHLNTIRFWLNRGVDGMRFDAVAHLFENGAKDWYDQPENIALLQKLKREVDLYENRYMVCESTARPRRYGASDVCGSAFELNQTQNLIKASMGDALAIKKVAAHFADSPLSSATLLANHDAFAGIRIWNQLDGNQARYRLAAATYLLGPGIPFLYYGEEIGMEQITAISGDPALRGPMSWTGQRDTAGFGAGGLFRPLAPNYLKQNVAAQKTDPDSLLAFYQSLTALRAQYPALRFGAVSEIKAGASSLQFIRGGDTSIGSKSVWVALNYGASPMQLSTQGLPSNVKLIMVLSSLGSKAEPIELNADAQGNVNVQLRAQTVMVFAIDS
jgi:alpha-amylase